jgi:hypothetical protein
LGWGLGLQVEAARWGWWLVLGCMYSLSAVHMYWRSHWLNLFLIAFLQAQKNCLSLSTLLCLQPMGRTSNAVFLFSLPFLLQAPKERHRFKQILASQELLFPNVYSSLLEAMKPLMAFDTNASEGFKDRLLIANQNNFQNGGLKEEELDLNEF